MRECVILAALLAGSIPSLGQHPPTPEEFFRSQMHLSAGEMSNIRKGEAIAKILDSSSATDIFVFGAVYIHAEPVMEVARSKIQWNSLNVIEEVKDLAKHGTMQLPDSYQHYGDRALRTYRDKRDPLAVAEHFRSVLSRVEFFPQYLPELNHYLLEFPRSRPAGTDHFFYWEKSISG